MFKKRGKIKIPKTAQFSLSQFHLKGLGRLEKGYRLQKCNVFTGELGYEGPLYDGFFHMTDDMLGPSPVHIKYSSYVCDGFCIWWTNFPGPIESVISKFTCISDIKGAKRRELWWWSTYFCFRSCICRRYLSLPASVGEGERQSSPSLPGKTSGFNLGSEKQQHLAFKDILSNHLLICLLEILYTALIRSAKKFQRWGYFHPKQNNAKKSSKPCHVGIHWIALMEYC